MFATWGLAFLSRIDVENHGPLGTIWVSIGLGCFYIALIWINSLLGVFLTPLFLMPVTWFQKRRNVQRATPGR